MKGAAALEESCRVFSFHTFVCKFSHDPVYSANNIAYMIVFQRKRKHDIFYQEPITDSIYEHKMQAVLNQTKAWATPPFFYVYISEFFLVLRSPRAKKKTEYKSLSHSQFVACQFPDFQHL